MAFWSYQITPRHATGETPFSFAFGMEVVIPLEIDFLIGRSYLVEASTNEDFVSKKLDLAEEKHERALVRLARYQLEIARVYNK